MEESLKIFKNPQSVSWHIYHINIYIYQNELGQPTAKKKIDGLQVRLPTSVLGSVAFLASRRSRLPSRGVVFGLGLTGARIAKESVILGGEPEGIEAHGSSSKTQANVFVNVFV